MKRAKRKEIEMIINFMGIKETECLYESYGKKVSNFRVNFGLYNGKIYSNQNKAMKDFIKFNRFQTDWNWIMPVVEKLCKEGFLIRQPSNPKEKLIDEIYLSVIETLENKSYEKSEKQTKANKQITNIKKTVIALDAKSQQLEQNH